MPAASVLVVGTAPLHIMSRSFILTHGSAWCWWLVGPGFRGLASLGPFLGAPAGSPGQVKYYWGHGVRGLASPDPFLGAFRGVPHHRSWKMWRWFSLCLLLGDRSWYASATDHAGCGGGQFRRLPLVQFLDKVADMPVASMTGAWGRQCRKLWCSQLQY